MPTEKSLPPLKRDLKNIEDKNLLREIINGHVAEWLSQGNTIKRIESGETILGESPPTFGGNSLWTRDIKK
jgi:hypothetical protein